MHRNRRESRSLRRRPRRLIRCMRRGWFWFTHSRIFPEASPDMVKHSLSVYGQIFYTRALRAAAGPSRNAAADFFGPVRVAGEPEPVCDARGPRDFSHPRRRSEEHTSELQSLRHIVCRLLLEKKKTKTRGKKCL